MTNRMLTNDIQMSRFPTSLAEWAAYHRQLGEVTAPGAEYRVLPNNYVTDTTTWSNVTDGVTFGGTIPAHNISVSLMAGVKYHIKLFGAYKRAGTSTQDVRVKLIFDGTTAGQAEDSAMAHFMNVGLVEEIDHLRTPLTTLSMGSGGGNGYAFKMEGWMNVSVAGELILQLRQLTDDGNDDVTLFSGTTLIVQPITNLADRGNP